MRTCNTDIALNATHASRTFMFNIMVPVLWQHLCSGTL